METVKNQKIKNAVMIGTLCSVSYLAVYFARNILSTVTPQMIESDGFTTEYIGTVSSLYFIMYAIGQLINGIIGDKIKARYMISFGLILAGICTVLFPHIITVQAGAKIVYGLTGFFLSMIYAPMTKVVSENTEPKYATRCSLGYTFASFLGSPLAGVAASFLAWRSVFNLSSITLFAMGGICFVLFLMLEKKEIVKYNQYKIPKKEKSENGIKVLVKNRIIRFTLISVITGIVRTTVVFWLPTYISQYLGFSADKSAMIFTVATFVISMSAFIAVFIYERLDNNMDLTILIAFISASLSFAMVYFLKQPVFNIIFIVLAILSSNCAASMLWSRYCPSLRDTGMVSSATGFLDFASYVAAAVSSTLFANAVSTVGWKNLILIWFALMVAGVVVIILKNKKK